MRRSARSRARCRRRRRRRERALTLSPPALPPRRAELRITDSVYPFHDKHAIFRIELEYGDSAVKWVIYRELKDFVNLHAHYRVANLRQGIDKFPAFPKTSLPYLNWLKSEGRGNVGKADFARMQREALENYLLKLIRATVRPPLSLSPACLPALYADDLINDLQMFGAGANRLCKFLEISAMSIQLATRGGEQGKQGYLVRLPSSRPSSSSFYVRSLMSSRSSLAARHVVERRQAQAARLPPDQLEEAPRAQVVHRARQLHRRRREPCICASLAHLSRCRRRRLTSPSSPADRRL